jgi:hypothetical protein
LVLAAVLLFLDSLLVSGADRLLLSTRHPFLVWLAVLDIFQGSGRVAAQLFVLVASSITLLWVLASAIGRTAVLDALAPAESPLGRHPRRRTGFGAVFSLNLVRAALAWLALVGLWAAAVAAGLATRPAYGDRPGWFLLVWLFLTIAVALVWAMLSWFLRLAAVVAVRDQRDSITAFVAAVAEFRERAGAFVLVNSAFGFLRLFLLAFAALLALAPVPLWSAGLWLLALALWLLIALLYFAALDYLRLAQLAAYVVVLGAGEDLRPPQPSIVNFGASSALPAI